MKTGRPIYIFLLIFTGMLVLVSGCLFNRNLHYKHENRKLILQNDSLMGVLIDINRTIQQSEVHNLPETEPGKDAAN